VGAKRVSVSRVEAGKGGLPKAAPPPPHPIVVMKLDVKLSSAKRSSRQLFPTPAHKGTGLFEQKQVPAAWITRLSSSSGLTAVAYEQQLDEVVIVLSPRAHTAAELPASPRTAWLRCRSAIGARCRCAS
jgi:hypothetical protein